MKTIVRTHAETQTSQTVITVTLEIPDREGARRLIMTALDVEVTEYLPNHRESRKGQGF